MNIITPVKSLPKLHATPLAIVTCNSPTVSVEVDDENEQRIRLVFSPYQAARIITADCFTPPERMCISPQYIMEILDSTWIEELNRASRNTDYDADFMEKARHFLLALQDSYLEIIAWDVTVEGKE